MKRRAKKFGVRGCAGYVNSHPFTDNPLNRIKVSIVFGSKSQSVQVK
jgi:hypothetical protein